MKMIFVPKRCLHFLLVAALAVGVTGSGTQAQSKRLQVNLLTFQEFFEPHTNELRPSEKLLSLHGKRVRLAGFMAKMEEPLNGAFYLCSRPVYADESGGGNGDLPVNAVRVTVQDWQGKQVAYVPNAFAVIGRLEVGPKTEDNGTVSAIRLILDKSEAGISFTAGKPSRNVNQPTKPTTQRRK